MTRGSPAVVIVPKAAEPTVVFAAPNGGVFVRLKISARTSRRVLSPQRDSPQHGKIEIAIAWPANRIAGAAPDRELGRSRECARIEPPRHRTLSLRKLRIVNQVGTLRPESCKGDVVGRLRDRERNQSAAGQ